ncbi:MAG: DUF2628 domain-containing protein [Clostridia bacterium]|nr:DUF2628 domain-containing protein [Clostridia bacterium]
MSLNNSGEKCAVCKAYLFEEDDVVYCPECGAPHHRDCYSSIGHCALEEFHGTENQYKKPEPVKEEESREALPVQSSIITCGMCGEKYETTDDFCPNCNTPNVIKTGGGRFVTFDFLGGVSGNTDLGNGVTANEAKKFVLNNTHRYIPKFAGFKKGKKASWNWLAFLTPCGWLMSRKMYLLGAIIGALEIAFTMLSVPLTAALNQLDTSSVRGTMEMAALILENISSIGVTAVYAAAIGGFLSIALSIIIATFGDLIYRNRVISKVSEIKRESEDKAEDYRKKGGISLFGAVLGYFAVSYLPTIIAYTLGML